MRAFIVCKSGQSVDADALLAWCKDNMATRRRVSCGSLTLPATGAGKVLRRLLRDIP